MRAIYTYGKMIGVLAVLATLPACATSSLEDLRHAEASGTPFQKALAEKYLAYADAEEKNYDWDASTYFAQKGLTAAYGKDVSPELIGDWALAPEDRAPLEQARADLVNTLTPELIEEKPEEAAIAIVSFDCWIENQVEGWQVDEIKRCRDAYSAALTKLKEKPEPVVPAPEAVESEEVEQPVEELKCGEEGAPECPAPLVTVPQEEPKEEVAPEPAPAPEPVAAPEPPPAPSKQAYIVFFGWNRADLDDKATKVVNEVSDDLKTAGDQNYTVILNGYTDTSGSKKYNFELSKRRADAVLQALIERGVPKMLIRGFGFGETELRVQTPDGVKEPQNRRVEIFLGE